jgi:hypothetical protein
VNNTIFGRSIIIISSPSIVNSFFIHNILGLRASERKALADSLFAVSTDEEKS